ncbi:hypothetical protein V6N13_035022 [Hibiscus sabdariffa]|uniref:Uncharacterized protein n=1 Tax=Hibiscus sabdariffa TaxID=183260 RepID=A0ABR2AF96_9ROSI
MDGSGIDCGIRAERTRGGQEDTLGGVVALEQVLRLDQCIYDTRKKDRYSHGRNRAVALRKRARDFIKVIGQGSKPALVPNRAQARDITI